MEVEGKVEIGRWEVEDGKEMRKDAKGKMQNRFRRKQEGKHRAIEREIGIEMEAKRKGRKWDRWNNAGDGRQTERERQRKEQKREEGKKGERARRGRR